MERGNAVIKMEGKEVTCQQNGGKKDNTAIKWKEKEATW